MNILNTNPQIYLQRFCKESVLSKYMLGKRSTQTESGVSVQKRSKLLRRSREFSRALQSTTLSDVSLYKRGQRGTNRCGNLRTRTGVYSIVCELSSGLRSVTNSPRSSYADNVCTERAWSKCRDHLYLSPVFRRESAFYHVIKSIYLNLISNRSSVHLWYTYQRYWLLWLTPSLLQSVSPNF